MKTAQKFSDACFFSILGIVFALLCNYFIYNRYDSDISLFFFVVSMVFAWMSSTFAAEEKSKIAKKFVAVHSFANRAIIISLALALGFKLVLPILILGIILFTLVTVNRSINRMTDSIFIGEGYSRKTYLIDCFAILLWLTSITVNYETFGYLISDIFGVVVLYTLLVTAIIRFIYYFVDYLDLDEMASANI